jgi:hypothetical protein
MLKTRLVTAAALVIMGLLVAHGTEAAEECAGGMQAVNCSNMGSTRTCMVVRNASAGGTITMTTMNNVVSCNYMTNGAMITYTAVAMTSAAATRTCVWHAAFGGPACCTCTIDMNSLPDGLPVELMAFEVDGHPSQR